MMKTIFCDIDGTLLYHHGSLDAIAHHPEPIVLDGVVEKMRLWYNLGCRIIVVTARPSSMEALTRFQLEKVGIPFHVLLMDCTHGERVVINDEKPTGEPSARAVVVKRDKGFKDVNL
jgi:hypothetical protein